MKYQYLPAGIPAGIPAYKIYLKFVAPLLSAERKYNNWLHHIASSNLPNL